MANPLVMRFRNIHFNMTSEFQYECVAVCIVCLISPLTHIHSYQYNDTLPLFSETLEIRNVWAENVEEEMSIIRELIETHPYVAMDTEFPGVVARPVSETYSPDFHYKSLKVNVDLLKIIQLGLSFADKEGNFAKGCPCWQFNFKFNLNDDMFAQDSIDLLINSGISFDDHATRGIDPLRFGEILMVSGLVLDDRVKWVSFHSGYDYGYLLKLLTTKELPNDEKTFFDTLKLYFPTIYDIKFMTSLCDGHFGGLQKLADALGCQRVGAEHQAGSDSLLTMTTYFSLARAKFANGTGSANAIDDSKYKNELYGYGTNHTVRKGNAHAHVHMSTSSSALSISNGGSVGGE
jgi:CCR4-NOT transcription complex subunit 7/8